MRHIRIATALAIVALVSFAAAQQTTTTSTDSEKQNSPTPPPGPILGGMGTANYIPIWASSSFLLNSVIYQANGGNVGIGTTTPAAKLDVNGNVNSATTYGIGGSAVVGIGGATDDNLFLGVGAGIDNVEGHGRYNTFSGYQAGASNTTGLANTFSGYGAGLSNTTAGFNAFYGTEAGANNTVGGSNAFYGYSAGSSNISGYANTFIASSAGQNNTTGYEDTFEGFSAGVHNTTGQENTFLGIEAGSNNTIGNNDIYIGNRGPTSGTESNTIRIGGDIGEGYGPQTAAYIVGIYGSTTASGVPVYIDSNGQLGTQTSSLRFKEQVRDMGDSTAALMKLRPVTFVYKPEYANGERTLQYGLVAEEVAKIYPELVAYDNDGKPYSVRYQYLSTMLLNEVQKQYRRAETEAAEIKAQQQEIEGLRQQLQLQNATLRERLSRLEKLVRVNTAEVVPQRTSGAQ